MRSSRLQNRRYRRIREKIITPKPAETKLIRFSRFFQPFLGGTTRLLLSSAPRTYRVGQSLTYRIYRANISRRIRRHIARRIAPHLPSSVAFREPQKSVWIFEDPDPRHLPPREGFTAGGHPERSRRISSAVSYFLPRRPVRLWRVNPRAPCNLALLHEY